MFSYLKKYATWFKILILKFLFRSSVFKFERQEEFRRKTTDSSYKGVLLDYQMEVMLWNKRNINNATLTICEEIFQAVHSVFLTRKNFYGLKRINEKVDQLKYSGIIHRFIQKNLDFRLQNKDLGPTALTVHQLAGIFEVMFGGLLLATFVFFIELCRTFKISKIC